MDHAIKQLRSRDSSQNEEAIAQHMSAILHLIGEDTNREGLRDTPLRFAKAINSLTKGYEENFEEIVNNAIFQQTGSGMVVIKDIDFFSLCEHHLLPFFGKAHVAYIPNDKVIGLSKIPRIVNAFARRLQIQEKLSLQIANKLMEQLAPKGVAVIIEAFHMCVMMRGVEKQNSQTLTTSFVGAFENDSNLRQEVVELLKLHQK